MFPLTPTPGCCGLGRLLVQGFKKWTRRWFDKSWIGSYRQWSLLVLWSFCFPFYVEQKYESCWEQASWYYIQLLNDMMCLPPSLCIVFFLFLGTWNFSVSLTNELHLACRDLVVVLEGAPKWCILCEIPRWRRSRNTARTQPAMLVLSHHMGRSCIVGILGIRFVMYHVGLYPGMSLKMIVGGTPRCRSLVRRGCGFHRSFSSNFNGRNRNKAANMNADSVEAVVKLSKFRN